MHNLFSLIMERFEEEGAQGAHPVEAYQWMKQAADAFFPPAMMNLALASVQPDGEPPVPWERMSPCRRNLYPPY